MPFVSAPPCIERPGVVAGFTLSKYRVVDGIYVDLGLKPWLSLGVLFAQGEMYRPATDPTLALSNAPASQQSWLYYNSVSGFYWRDEPTPTTADDAFIGWVVTNGSTIIAVSNQQIAVAAAEDAVTVISLGPVIPIAAQDADAPPAPLWGLFASLLGYFEFNELQFAVQENISTVHTATFSVWSWDETAPVETALSAGIDEDDEALTAEDLGSFSEGDYAVLDGEIVILGEITGNAVAIARGQLGSTAAAHEASARLIRLTKTLITSTFAFGFFLEDTGHKWRHRVPFRDQRMVAMQCYVTNNVGNSPITTGALTASDDHGFRVLSGAQQDIVVQGVLGIQSTVAPPVYLPQTSSIRDLYARVDIAPDGADLVVDVLVDGEVLATLTIADGETVAHAEGRDLPAIPVDAPVTIDITGVGTTFPGQDLVVSIRL